MKLIYSIGAKFAGGGIGTPAYHAVRGFLARDCLQRLLCGSYQSSKIPERTIRSLGIISRGLRKLATYDPSGWLWYLESIIYDRWAMRHLHDGDTLYVWGNYGLSSLRRAKQLDMMTIVERASTHPLYQARLLGEEFARWGMTFLSPQPVISRAVNELALADAVTIPSDFVRQSFLAEGFSEEKLIQTSYGVDTNRFYPGNHDDHPFRVLFLGDVCLRKGVPYLLAAWKLLNWKDAELWLVGRVRNEIQPILNLYRHLTGLRLLAFTPDPLPVLQGADIFALPTVEEGSALVTYEALACGLPVITTPNAGSVVRHTIEGFILPIRDVEAIAHGLERLRANPNLHEYMAEAARRRALQFSWQNYSYHLAENILSWQKSHLMLRAKKCID
ncbi:MAG: glycosyltransferase family 4 protein [Chloroflexota bacterium]